MPPNALNLCFNVARNMYPDLKEQLQELRKHLVESTNEMAPLKVWQMQGSLPFPKDLPVSVLFLCILWDYVAATCPCLKYILMLFYYKLLQR